MFYDITRRPCAISSIDPIAALKEMRRVCKPDDQILLIEHGRSHYPWLGNYQDTYRDQIVEQGGCRWNQDPLELVQKTGLTSIFDQRTLVGIFDSIQAPPGKSD